MKKIIPYNAILIPDNAKLVFKGQIFDVYQWPQTLFDGSQATFEMLRRPDTVQVIAVKDQKLILVNDEQPGRTPRVHFAGGRTDDKDDSWESTAKRELTEETGLSFKNWKLIAVNQPIPKIEWFVSWFLATGLESEHEQKLDAGEKIAPIDFDFETVRQKVMSGDESTLNYAMPLFAKIKNMQELLNLPAFGGKEVDR